MQASVCAPTTTSRPTFTSARARSPGWCDRPAEGVDRGAYLDQRIRLGRRGKPRDACSQLVALCRRPTVVTRRSAARPQDDGHLFSARPRRTQARRSGADLPTTTARRARGHSRRRRRSARRRRGGSGPSCRAACSAVSSTVLPLRAQRIALPCAAKNRALFPRLKLDSEWRRRESNPRPRTRQEGLLQAQPAFMSRRVAPRRPVLRWPVRRWSPLRSARTPRPPGKPPSEGLPPRRPGGATRYVIRLRSEREIQIGLRIWCLLDDLRGPPASSACYPTHRIRPRRSQDAPESPSSVARAQRPICGLFGPQPRERVFISRSISRRTSRSASVRRLSMPSLPRASAISTLTRPSLK